MRSASYLIDLAPLLSYDLLFYEYTYYDVRRRFPSRNTSLIAYFPSLSTRSCFIRDPYPSYYIYLGGQ
jgi:hypothetical protein